MKKIFLTILTLSFCFLTNAQDKPKIGDILIINASSNINYNHINFPKLNFLVKRGKQANYKNVHGNKVVIKDVIDNDNGNTYVILEKKNGKKFFGFLNEVKANFYKSIKSGEMQAVKS